MITEAQAEEALALLRAIAKQLGARVPRADRPTADIDQWRALNRELAQIRPDEPQDPREPAGIPPAGGTPPEEFFRRRDG